MFGEDLKRALMTARNEAHRLRHESVRPEHHALGVLLNPSPAVSAVLCGIQTSELVFALEERAGPGTASLAMYDLPYTDGSRSVIELAAEEARTFGHDEVGCEHLFLGLLQVDGLPRALFDEHGVTAGEAREVIRVARSRDAALRRLVQTR